MIAARSPCAGTLVTAPGLAMLVGLLAGFIVTRADAQETLAQQVLARCASVADDGERLACYDAAAHWIEAVEPTAGAQDSTELASKPPRTAPDVSTFGLEQIGDAAAADEITSRILGTFSGWHGNTRFKLENGQVWRQDEPGRGIYRSEAPRVTIRRGAMGTFLMEIEGVRRSLRVRRVE